MKVARILPLALSLFALALFPACDGGDDTFTPDPSGDGGGGADTGKVSKDAKTVDLPSDPFFTDFAYPGATPADTLSTGGTTSVWFKSDDDFSKIAQFYTEKSAGGRSHVEAERAYFSLPAGGGGGGGERTVTVTAQPDGSSQILLALPGN